MNRLTAKLLGWLGSILGITAMGCTGHGGALYGPPVAMYGMPYAEYKLSGTVLDSSTNNPIPGISLAFGGATTTSAADGTWSMDVSGATYCDSNCTMQASDVDGTTNSTYTDATVALSPTQVSAGSGTWDHGVFEQKSIQVSLNPKP
jgi:putative lipoprotein (rSAM/lipoprotein system)